MCPLTREAPHQIFASSTSACDVCECDGERARETKRTLPMNAENSVLRPSASTNASQAAVPEEPDMA